MDKRETEMKAAHRLCLGGEQRTCGSTYSSGATSAGASFLWQALALAGQSKVIVDGLAGGRSKQHGMVGGGLVGRKRSETGKITIWRY